MGRSNVEVAPVEKADLPELVGLWLASRVDSGVPLEVATRFADDGRLEAALDRDELTAHLARLDGRAVGYVVTSENPFGLQPEPEVAIELLFVEPEARRHGVARALLSTVTALAERVGSDVVVSNVPTQSREANRFFARLGFSSVLVRRVVGTTQLRRRLTPKQATARTGSAVDQLIRRRRSLRAVASRAS
ncbi:acetyltransferase (GNAT) family protein [Knoellia remsis]|uniref:Acetyltransferase (GNAT) family protein n=1 Tax=Knoellia remsis TaxID=407159 RepID=A0A2T0UUC2_9MICO|nr:GNAT family N-acetyltransferase [Knoellia remsis]PRY61521.1 acetyltransferase (GNAT) family protein [Knoellia remsis]